MFTSFAQVDCTNEKLEEFRNLYSDNSFMTYCADLHFWAMGHKEDLIEYEEPYILESNDAIGPGERQTINIKRPGKYAFSVDSESKAKELKNEALKILKANNQKVKMGKGKLKLNLKILPASGIVKLSVNTAYKVTKKPVSFVTEVFEEELFQINRWIDSTSDKKYSKELKDELKAIEERQQNIYARIKKDKIKNVRVATRNGEQYRFSYFDPIEERRRQAGFGDVIIFYNGQKPLFRFSEASKKRTDTRENSPGLLYKGIYNDIEIFITI